MKFGKRFQAEITPEWKTKYLDYKQLKKCIKRVQKFSSIGTHNVQDEFTIKITNELKKINEFYITTEKRFAEKHGQLDIQIREYVSRKKELTHFVRE